MSFGSYTNPNNLTGAIITATDSGDHQNYVLARLPSTSVYSVILNNGVYPTDDSTFGFSVTGMTLMFNSPLPTDLASLGIKLLCV